MGINMGSCLAAFRDRCFSFWNLLVSAWGSPPSDTVTYPETGYKVLDMYPSAPFCTVALARHEKSGELVVLKRFHAIERDSFARELVMLRRAQGHDNVNCLRASWPSSHLLVLDYVEGQCLIDVMLNREPPYVLPMKMVTGITRQLVSVLCHLKARDVVHNDISPENIIVRPDRGVVLIDFGLSMRSAERKADKSFIGKPCFIAPEVTLRKTIEEPFSVDMYSLGSVLCYASLLATPYEAPFYSGSLYHHKGKDIIKIFAEQSGLKLPGDFLTLLADMLDPNPTTRIACEAITL